MPKRSRQDKFYESDQAQFLKAFTANREWFMSLGDWYEPRTGDLLVHQDNGKKILIVCHTDYIVPTIPAKDSDAAWIARYGPHQPLPAVPNFGPFKFKNTGRWWTQEPTPPKKLSKEEEDTLSYEWVADKASKLSGPVVDDRLGCALALGCTSWADILFTDCEEQGRSTAAYFQAPRAYNWIIGFDRRGTDVVTYNYKDKDWLDALGETFNVGQGSFSDIGYLENLGTACVNMGVGYYNEHTTDAYWTPKDAEEQMNRLYVFWSKYSGTQFNHVPPKTVVKGEPGRHQGKEQISMHGREWLLDVPEPTKTLVSTGTNWNGVLGNRHYGSNWLVPSRRFEPTAIKDTVWDSEAADYRNLMELDMADVDVQDFIEINYPTFLADLAAYKDAIHRDIPSDPLGREFSWGYSF